MDGWPPVTGRPAVARRSILNPEAAGCHDSARHLAPSARSPIWLRVSEPAKLPPSLIVRAATNEDVLAMAQVHIASWRETYPGLLPQPMLAELSIANEAIRRQRMLDRPRALGRTLAFVAEHQGEIVAYGSCNDQRTGPLYDRGFTGEVSELYVLRKAQRQGAGSLLLSAMAGALLERGHRGFSLWVLERNGAVV